MSTSTRWAWTACAAVSLLSTKYLLVDLNVHYPLHLHLIQLAATTLLTVQQLLPQELQLSSLDRGSYPAAGGWMILIGVTSLMAASMILNLQAVLHFQNLPTLVMLSVSSPPGHFQTPLLTIGGDILLGQTRHHRPVQAQAASV